MGKIKSDKEKKFEKSKNIVQFLYYILAIVFISITIWFTLILPNMSFPINNISNNTLPLLP
jgi:hypothetical protein